MSKRTDWFCISLPIIKEDQIEWGEWFRIGLVREDTYEGLLERLGFTKKKDGDWFFTSKKVEGVEFKVTSESDANATVRICRKSAVKIERIRPAIEVKAVDAHGNVNHIRVEPELFR